MAYSIPTSEREMTSPLIGNELTQCRSFSTLLFIEWMAPYLPRISRILCLAVSRKKVYPAMYQTVFYLIRPNDALKQRLESLDADWACLFTELTLWSRRESSEVSVEVSTWVILREVQVKLLFMLDIVSEYISSSDSVKSELQSFLSELLEFPNVKVEIFDKWWSLERIDGLASTFEDAERRLTKHSIEAAETPIINGAFEWIQCLKREIG
jgi:hypothetical protein